MSQPSAPVVTAQMLIRRPAAMVFAAFIDPAITTNFWFTRSSGPLAAGETVTWEWEMYGASAEVSVREVVQDRQLVIDWGEPATTVSIEFEERPDQSTYVTIRNYGFQQTGDELIAAVMDATGGFTTVLDGLKAYLEHNIRLNLIGDKFPQQG